LHVDGNGGAKTLFGFSKSARFEVSITEVVKLIIFSQKRRLVLRISALYL
jgi:hypothetical protein